MACTVHGVMMEVCVSVFLDMKELDMCAVEKSCQKNAAAVLLNVYGDGVVASVRKAALLDTELAGNQKLAQHETGQEKLLDPLTDESRLPAAPRQTKESLLYLITPRKKY